MSCQIQRPNSLSHLGPNSLFRDECFKRGPTQVCCLGYMMKLITETAVCWSEFNHGILHLLSLLQRDYAILLSIIGGGSGMNIWLVFQTQINNYTDILKILYFNQQTCMLPCYVQFLIFCQNNTRSLKFLNPLNQFIFSEHSGIFVCIHETH